MSLLDQLLANWRTNLFLYFVCVLGVIAVVKYMANHQRQRKYTIAGICFIGLTNFLMGIIRAITYAVVFSADTKGLGKEWQAAVQTFNVFSTVMSFLEGILQAAGVACLLYAILMDKMKISAKKSKRNSRRDEVDEDEEERPRRRNRRDDDEEEDREEKPRSRRRQNDDD